MATEYWVDPSHRGFNESHDEIRQTVAKISFSNKLKLDSTLPISGARPIDEHGYFDSRNGGLRKTEMFFARIGGFPEEGVKWITENFKNIKLNAKRHEDLGGALHRRPLRVSVPRGRGRRHVVFASVSENLDPATKEQLEETKEDVIDTAQKARVPVPAATLPFIGFIHSLTIKNLLCGVLAGAAGATIIVPFDVLRTRVIAGQGGQTTGQVLGTVIHKEGLQALNKASLSINIVKNSIEKGLQFATYEFVKRYQERHRDSGKQKKVLPFLPRQIPVATAGGAAGGLVATLVGYPLQPVFDRVLIQPEKYGSLVEATKQILRNEGGFRELYRGITPALIAIVPQAALSFYTYETLKSKYLSKTKLKPQVEALRSLIIGGLAGVVSSTLTYPLELAREQILLSSLSKQAVHFAEGNVRYNNTWQALNGIVKANGWQGLFRGLPAQSLQIVPMTAVSFMVYELAKAAFVATDEESRDELKDADDIKK